MGSNTIFKLILAVVLAFSAAVPALAQGPTPATPEIPYTFEPLDYETAQTNTTASTITDLITSVPFINSLGSYIVTVWDMLDNFAGGGVLGYFVILICAVWIIKWLSNFVFKKNAYSPVEDKQTKKDDKDPATLPRRSSRKYF